MGGDFFTLVHFHNLHNLVGIFPFCLFFCYRWHPHHWACFSCISCFSSFLLVKFGRPWNSTLHLCYLVSFGVVFRVFASIWFLYPYWGIKVLGVPFKVFASIWFGTLLRALRFWVFPWDPFPSHPFFPKMPWIMLFNI